MARFHAQKITDEERKHRKKPILDRVMELAPLLCSDDLYMRSYAANNLGKDFLLFLFYPPCLNFYYDVLPGKYGLRG